MCGILWCVMLCVYVVVCIIVCGVCGVCVCAYMHAYVHVVPAYAYARDENGTRYF